MSSNDKSRGIYGKFRVERTDGKSAPGEKHDGCSYYVLDLDHDPHAIPALRAYAESCRLAYPTLAADILEIVGEDKPGRAMKFRIDLDTLEQPQ